MEKELPEYLKFNEEDGSVDITLPRPADIEGAKVAALRMREPTVGDQEIAFQMTGSDAAKEITLFANLCGVTPGDIRKLPIRAHSRLLKAYSVFTD